MSYYINNTMSISSDPLALRWNEFEVNEQNNCRYSDESECGSQVRKKLKEQIDAAIIELGKKSNEKWDKSGKHTWRGGKK